MNTIVAETWITLDSRLFRENVIVLVLKIANDLSKTILSLVSCSGSDSPLRIVPCLVIDQIAKTWCIHDGERNSGSLFVQFQFYQLSATICPDNFPKGVRTNSNWLDLDVFLDMSVRRIVSIESGQNLLPAECVHECGPS
jgi:hypothetical protein